MTNDEADKIILEHIGKISNLGEGHPVEKLNFYRDLVRAGFQQALAQNSRPLMANKQEDDRQLYRDSGGLLGSPN